MFSLGSPRWFGLFLAPVAAALFLATAAWADIPGGTRPRPPRPADAEPLKDTSVPFTLELERRDLPMRVEIPRALLPKEGRPGAAGAFGGLDGARTIVAGLALTLAVGIGGLWLVRRVSASGRRLPKVATAATAAAVLLAGFSVAAAWADLGFPRARPRPADGHKLKAQVVIVEKGDSIVVRASAEDFAAMVEEATLRAAGLPAGAKGK